MYENTNHYLKTLSTIRSCTTFEQLVTARQYAILFLKTIDKSSDKTEFLRSINDAIIFQREHLKKKIKYSVKS